MKLLDLESSWLGRDWRSGGQTADLVKGLWEEAVGTHRVLGRSLIALRRRSRGLEMKSEYLSVVRLRLGLSTTVLIMCDAEKCMLAHSLLIT